MQIVNITIQYVGNTACKLTITNRCGTLEVMSDKFDVDRIYALPRSFSRKQKNSDKGERSAGLETYAIGKAGFMTSSENY
jgi:hypothetical protein